MLCFLTEVRQGRVDGKRISQDHGGVRADSVVAQI